MDNDVTTTSTTPVEPPEPGSSSSVPAHVPRQAESPEVAARVDVESLKSFLDGAGADTLEIVRELLGTGRITAPSGLALEEHRAWVREALVLLKEVPGPVSGMPCEFGGLSDLDVGLVAAPALAHGDLSLWVKAGVQWGLFGGAILNLGTARHHEELLARVVSLDLMGCFAMTESGHGSNVHAVETTATFDADRDELVVHSPTPSARKDYIGSAGRDAQLAVVFAQLHTDGAARGVHAVLVPIRNEDGAALPGVTIEDDGPKAGLNGVDNGRLSFDHVRVPRGNLLNRYGDVARDGTYTSEVEDPAKRFFTMLGTLVQGRVSVAGAGLAAAQSGLAITVRYAAARRQFSMVGSDQETVLLQYRAHQRRLLPALAASYALAFAQAEVRTTLVEMPGDAPTRERRRLEARVAGHKAMATWHALRTLREAREACGGAGYLAVNRIPELLGSCDVFVTFEGDNTVLSQLVAKNLLTEYKDQFGDMNVLATARFAAAELADQVLERTSARATLERIRRTGPGGESGGVRDSAWHLEMLEVRERLLVSGAVRRIRAGARAGAPQSETLNDCQPHLLHAARAHTERLTFEAFVTAVRECPDPGTRRVLDMVCDLYALTVLEADRGWFLEHGRMSASRSKALTRAVDELCKGLAEHALDLVEAWAIPPAAIPAPIAWSDPSRTGDPVAN